MRYCLFTYTPVLDFNGTDSFTYKANDGAVDSNEATVSITVTTLNSRPDAQASMMAAPDADVPGLLPLPMAMPVSLMPARAVGIKTTSGITVINEGAYATWSYGGALFETRSNRMINGSQALFLPLILR